jgi:hypothetical protein
MLYLIIGIYTAIAAFINLTNISDTADDNKYAKNIIINLIGINMSYNLSFAILKVQKYGFEQFALCSKNSLSTVYLFWWYMPTIQIVMLFIALMYNEKTQKIFELNFHVTYLFVVNCMPLLNILVGFIFSPCIKRIRMNDEIMKIALYHAENNNALSRYHNIQTDEREGHVMRDDECSICLEHYVGNVTISTLLNCNHSFHTMCILKHMSTGNNTCPLCRAEMVMIPQNIVPAPVQIIVEQVPLPPARVETEMTRIQPNGYSRINNPI